MPYSHMRVDLSLIPEGELKNTFVHFAEQHNALVDGASEMKQDLDQISGDTPELKAEMHGVLAKVRGIIHYAHGKRFNAFLFSFQAYLALAIAKQLGVSPALITRLLEAVIKFLDKLS